MKFNDLDKLKKEDRLEYLALINLSNNLIIHDFDIAVFSIFMIFCGFLQANYIISIFGLIVLCILGTCQTISLAKRKSKIKKRFGLK